MTITAAIGDLLAVRAKATAVPSDSLADTVRDIRAYVRRYVVVTSEQATTIALWTAHTHAIEAADCTPYLQVTSATKRAGKTRLLEVLEPIVARPWLTGRTSAAALVRRTDRDHPTLLLDESDATLGPSADREYSEALRGLLNSGYRRSGRATICVGQGASLDVRDYSTFGAKAIAGIGDLPGTVADRAIRIVLRRRMSDEPVARWRERDGHAEAAPMHQALVSWASCDAVIEALRAARPELPGGLTDRLADTWEPLLAIADLSGGDWPTEARRAALALAGAAPDTDIVVELLRDIADIIGGDHDGAIAGSVLLERLTASEDRPWRDWRQGHPLTARGLARLLAPLDIHPDRHDTPIGRARGYRREALADAIARYVPSHVSMRPSSNEYGPNGHIATCPNDEAPDRSLCVQNSIDSAARTHGHIDHGESDAERL